MKKVSFQRCFDPRRYGTSSSKSFRAGGHEKCVVANEGSDYLGQEAFGSPGRGFGFGGGRATVSRLSGVRGDEPEEP